ELVGYGSLFPYCPLTFEVLPIGLGPDGGKKLLIGTGQYLLPHCAVDVQCKGDLVIRSAGKSPGCEVQVNGHAENDVATDPVGGHLQVQLYLGGQVIG